MYICNRKQTNNPLNTENMETWNIYIAESVYTKAEDGYGHKNTRKLEKVAEGLKDFRTECWPVIDELKSEILSRPGTWEGPLSRSESYCVDTLFRPATDEDMVRDYMFPNTVIIDIITTPYTLTLKAE